MDFSNQVPAWIYISKRLVLVLKVADELKTYIFSLLLNNFLLG